MIQKKLHWDGSGAMLTLAVLLMTLAVPLASAITAVSQKALISERLEWVFGAACMVLAGAALAAAMCLLYSNHLKRMPQVLKAELWLLCACVTWMLPWKGVGELPLETMLVHSNGLVVGVIVWCFLGLLVVPVLIFWMIQEAGAAEKPGFSAAVRTLIRHPLKGLWVFTAVIGCIAGYVVIGLVDALFAVRGYAGFVESVSCRMLLALVIYLILRSLLKALNRQSAEEEKVPVRQSSWKKTLAAYLVPGLLLTAGLLYQNWDLLFGSPVDRAVQAVRQKMIEAQEQLKDGNPELALQTLDLADARIRAIDACINENSTYDLNQIYNTHQDDPVIAALYLQKGGSAEEIERKILTGDLGEALYPVLLTCCDDRESVPDLYSEMLQSCISRGVFSNQVLMVTELEGHQLELQQKLASYRNYMDVCQNLSYLVEIGKQGSITENVVANVLAAAENAEHDMMLQYLACMLGSRYQIDGASHYGRTIEAALRFDALYDDGTKDPQALAAEKASMAEAASRCYDHKTALKFYREAYALVPETRYALSGAYSSLEIGDCASCMALASQAADADPQNTAALYLVCISALKQDLITEALDAAGKISQIMVQQEDPTQTEQMLFFCAEYLAMNDNTKWTDFAYCVYNKLTPEQLETAQSYPMLWAYMTAINQCYMSKDYEAAAQTTDLILQARGDLPLAWYLKGAIAFSAKDYESALDAFKRSEQLDASVPATLYCLANTYDALGDYETAYQYSLRVQSMLPGQDHGSDWYGISYHNNRLLEALRRELEKED